jgi:hypothetical protein
MSAIEDRHAAFLTSITPRLDNLAPVMVSEHGRGFWTVLDPPRHGVDSRVAFLAEGPGLAALESPELARLLAELLARYDPAYVPPPDLRGPFDPARDHLVVISRAAPPTCTGWTGASTRPRRCWWWSPGAASNQPPPASLAGS